MSMITDGEWLCTIGKHTVFGRLHRVHTDLNLAGSRVADMSFWVGGALHFLILFVFAVHSFTDTCRRCSHTFQMG